MGEVTDENRVTTIATINGLTTTQDTCIGKGLREGLAALKTFDKANGGVMILLTDGGYYCPDSATSAGEWESFPSDLDLIKAQNVRVITIAFSNAADDKIETLALETGGASFFVPDNSGPSDLNNAFSGALAYQPETPMAEKSVPIVEETFIGQKTVDVNFTIDQFASRELVLQLDFDSNSKVQISLDNVVLEEAFDTSAEEVYQNKNLNLSFGLHNLTVTSTSAMTALSVKVIGNVPDIFQLVMGRILFFFERNRVLIIRLRAKRLRAALR